MEKFALKFHYLAVLAAVSLSGCVSNPSTPSTDAKPQELVQAIQIFEQVCIKQAPSFAGSIQAAAEFGVKDVMDGGFATFASKPDKSLSVQVKEGRECAVTTPSQRDRTLSKQLLFVIQKYSTTTVATRIPTQGTIEGTSFLFHHDRKGGEAFVMLATDGVKK